MRLLALGLLLLLAACHRPMIDCRSEYLYPSYLASDQVETPDPCLECFYGQQVVMHWNLPRECLESPVTLELHLRYGTREIETLTFPVTTRKGWKIYRLINRDYWCKEGILAFQALLVQDGQVIDSWTHYLWADIIQIGE